MNKHVVALLTVTTTIVLASLLAVSPVKAATYYAEMPPYEDKWTLAGMGPPSETGPVTDADGDLATGKMTVYVSYVSLTEALGGSAHVKMWKRVWLPAGTIYIDCSWKLKGNYSSKWFTAIRFCLYTFIEESLNIPEPLYEEDLFRFYKDDEYWFADDVDEPWTSKSYPVTISEAGYYNVGASLFGAVGGLNGRLDFEGVVSMKLRYTCIMYWDSNDHGTIDVELPDRTMHLRYSLPIGTYHDAGTPVKITATPDSHYYLDYWILDGVIDYSDTLEFVVYEDHSVKAYFTFYNNAPNTPSTPSGPTYGYRNVWYTYSTSTIDPDEDDVRYQFEFTGPSTNALYTTAGWYPSGQTGSLTVLWGTSAPLGTYQVRVRAQDFYEEWSCWSPYLTVNIVNRAPNTPSKPSGPTALYENDACSYETSTTDPDGDDVRYQFDWGDGSYSWTGYYNSGVTVYASHSWSSTGYKSVRVGAYDVYGAWNGWSQSLEVHVIEHPGGCPILSVYDGTGYAEEGLLDIHNPDGIDVVFEHTLVSTPQRVDGAYLFRLVEHPQTHSFIDQVKLYAILEDKTVIELPLIWAWHSEDGNVLMQLLHSDEWKADTLGADHNNGTSQSIDLKFAAQSSNLEITGFVFQIEGNNMWEKHP